MASQRWTASILMGVGAVALCAGILTSVSAQQPPAGQAQGGRGGGRGGAGTNVFTAADENRDGFVTKEELRATFAKWAGASATQEQLASAISAAFPQPTAPGRGAQN